MMSRLWTIAVLIFSGIVLSAQEVDIKLSGTIAIQNAQIVQKPGQVIEKGSIVIKDGVIVSVGENVEIPADAVLVDADSMYIYPGFIDAYNTIGVKKEEEKKDQPRVKDPGNPPNDRAGIRPDRTLLEVFDGGDKSIASWRKAGFTASMSTPRGGMLPGQSSIILHSGKDASKSIVTESNALVGTFESANRMYPATIIGVMAKYRDLFRQTSYAMKHIETYEANPVGMARPAYDKSIKALMPAAAKDQSLFLEAQKLKDVSRALVLKEDLALEMVLVNVKQGSSYIDQIKEMGIPVVLSMDIPSQEEEKKKSDEEGEEKDESDDDPEMEALKKRREEAIAEYQGQAASFAKSDITFALSGKDIQSKEVHKNARLMVEAGLSEDNLLSALTTAPAELLGVSQVMGSIETGKLGNLVVTTAPYFDEDAKVKYVFVEGMQFEYEIEKKRAKVEEKASSLAGTYECTLDVPGDQQEMTIIISGSTDNYKVSVSSQGESTDAKDPDFDGNNLSFPLEVDYEGYDLKLTFDVSIENGSLKGSVTAGNFGSFPIKGERSGDPKN